MSLSCGPKIGSELRGDSHLCVKFYPSTNSDKLSENSNMPFSHSLPSSHRSPLILHSISAWPILPTNERQQLGWNDPWIGSNSLRIARDLWMRNSACATHTWLRKTASCVTRSMAVYR